jgi:DNA-binding response OmpR family regulator
MKVLIAEDDPTLGELLAAVLMDQGYTVIGVARTVTEAVILALERDEVRSDHIPLGRYSWSIPVVR